MLVSPKNLEDAFLNATEENTIRNIESVGVLCGTVTEDYIRVTHLMLPPQTGTANQVEVTDDAAITNAVLGANLVTVGWIHTHPSQTAFLSSIDLHTQWSYQHLLPEAVAVVCAPQYRQTKWLRLTERGMDIVGTCPFRGFHEHTGKARLFESALNIVYDPSDVLVIDLRGLTSPVIAESPRETQSRGCDSRKADGRTKPAPKTDDPGRSQETGFNQKKLGATPDTPTAPTANQQRRNETISVTQGNTPRSSISRLRNIAMKIEKHKSHRSFLTTCKAEQLIPKGFQVKWTCHFMNSPEIRSILQQTSRDLIEESAKLLDTKLTRLEHEFSAMHDSVKTSVSAEAINELESALQRSKILATQHPVLATDLL